MKLKMKMRLLKRKIARTYSIKAQAMQGDLHCFTSRPKPVSDIRATKNIVKNYAIAICKFALSSIASPYLEKFLQQEQVSLSSFLNYISSIKSKMDSLYYVRTALLITATDSKEMVSNKRLFAKISEVFVKFFSVNWIYNSKITHKDAHLKCRFKILRRIRNPKNFTF